MKRTIILIITIILLLAPGGIIRSSSLTPFYEIKRFGEQQRLSNRNINCIAQDTTGFLWIGTSNGLNKYDGSKVSTYFHNPEDDTSIGDNYIQKLFVDSEGVLWVLVPRFFCRYDEEKDCFIRYKYSDENKNTHTSNPGGIAEDNMEQLGIAPLAKRCYRELSGGQQQRVLLARALCATRKILLMDEPVAGLDPKATAEMYDYITKLNHGGATIIMISHDIAASVRYASHILHIGNQSTLFFGTKADYLISEAGQMYAGLGGEQA